MLITLHIRFQNCRRTNSPSRDSETSLAEGKVSKLHLPVFLTDANSSLPLSLPTTQPPREKFGAAYEEELLHVRPPVTRRKSEHKQCWNSLYMES